VSSQPERCGFVAFAGRPNSGKSTLLNSLVGEKVSIVTDKPQTTRNVVRGIVTRPQGQIVVLDTPGIHRPIHRMNDLMMKALRAAMIDVDVLALIVDASVPFGRGDEFAVELIKPVSASKLLILNKIDKIGRPELLPQMDRYSKLEEFEEIVPISARTGENMETLLAILFKYMPEGPPHYPADQLSDSPVRSIAGEIIREKIIDLTRDELPYSIAVVVDRFEEGEKIHRIHATIHVERETQKGIVIGKGGKLLKEIGTAARLDLERMLGQRVYLGLDVRVSRDWRNDEQSLKNFGLGES
jgi:GTP-binding protein Era